MGASPDWKIYRDGVYIGSAKYPEDAATFANACGDEVRYSHGKVVWSQLRDGAITSVRATADLMFDRMIGHGRRPEEAS